MCFPNFHKVLFACNYLKINITTSRYACWGSLQKEAKKNFFFQEIDAILRIITADCSSVISDVLFAGLCSVHDRCCGTGKQLNISVCERCLNLSFDSLQSLKTRLESARVDAALYGSFHRLRHCPGRLLNGAADVVKVSKHFQRLYKFDCSSLCNPDFHLLLNLPNTQTQAAVYIFRLSKTQIHDKPNVMFVAKRWDCV